MNAYEKILFMEKMAKQKAKRQMQIQMRLLTASFVILAIMGAVLFGMGIAIYAKEPTVMYAGFTEMTAQIDFDDIESLPVIVEEEVPVVEESIECPYSYEDLDLLAHIIYAEAGADWISDETLYYVGSVVLNRVASDMYPDNLHDVIYQKGQYAPTWDGGMNKTPNERAMEIAEDLLINGSVLPENVLGQAGFETLHGTYCVSDGIVFSYY